MRYHLPPPEEHGAGPVRALARTGATGGAGHEDAPAADPAAGRMVRAVALGSPAEAAAYLRAWAAQRPGARPLPVPAGMAAAERSRPDRAVPGATRRQRLAVTGAAAVHWSAPEPPTGADEAAWQRALERMAAGRDTGRAGGWRA